MSGYIFNGPRFGRDAMVERNGTPVTVETCECPTCRDLGAWLSEPVLRITFTDDGASIAHAPARWVK